MTKIRLSVTFECTVEVDNDSAEHVQSQEAKDAVSLILPYYLDGKDFLDSTVQGCNNLTCEKL
jgi:hypothetical protein